MNDWMMWALGYISIGLCWLAPQLWAASKMPPLAGCVRFVALWPLTMPMLLSDILDLFIEPYTDKVKGFIRNGRFR